MGVVTLIALTTTHKMDSSHQTQKNLETVIGNKASTA